MGKFLGQDFNLLDKLPVTAYDLTPLVVAHQVAEVAAICLLIAGAC